MARSLGPRLDFFRLPTQPRGRRTPQSSLRRRIKANGDEMGGRWDDCLGWLTRKGFVVPDTAMPSGQRLTPRGQVCGEGGVVGKMPLLGFHRGNL